MFVALGYSQVRVKVHQPACEPVRVSLRHRISRCRPSIDLAPHERLVNFLACIAGNEFRVLETKNVGEEATFIVGRETHGLAADPDSWVRGEFLYAAQARLFAGQKDRVI